MFVFSHKRKREAEVNKKWFGYFIEKKTNKQNKTKKKRNK